MKTATKPNAFAGLGNLLGKEFDPSFLAGEGKRAMFKIADIEVEKQVREEFEDDEQTLSELAHSMESKLQIQPVMLRKNRPGREKPYLLVIGGRRLKAAQLNKWDEIWGDYHPDMTDELAEELQLAENIHRKNLTLQEEASRIRRDLEALGSVDKLIAKHNKSRAWLSKHLALLDLPKEAQRLVTKNVTSDVEVINDVRQIEKKDPERAKAVVDSLIEGKGKVNARALTASVKEEVKPSPKKAAAKAAATGSVATAKDRSQEAPGPASVMKNLGRNASSPAELVARLYTAIREKGVAPKAALDAMKPEDRRMVTDWLQSCYDSGGAAKDIGAAVVGGFDQRMFAPDADGVVNLVAFLHGATGVKFSVAAILGALKQKAS